MTDVVSLPLACLDQAATTGEQQQATAALESGSVLLLPRLGFPLQAGENRLFTPALSSQAKNISLDLASGRLGGSAAGQADQDLLRRMMARFAISSRRLICNLLPRYEAELRPGRTSYRPVEITGRMTSWRKDDTRLHIDSFPSSPVQGWRILRVFTNINPDNQSRVWETGEAFEDLARRFAGLLPGPVPGASLALQWLGITKRRRSAYDHYMLRLHDQMKSDMAYQASVAHNRFEFPPGSTWILFSDQVSHAALAGQYALEQTFYLPVHAMNDPARSPLRVLEGLLGRQLT